MAAASINRVLNATTARAPLFPIRGGYSVTLAFGTPSQPLKFFFDSGSPLTFFPCGANYRCASCGVDSRNISTFKPKSSSTSKTVSCSNRRLQKKFPNSSRCGGCWNLPTRNCSKSPLDYKIIYGSWNTTGLYLSESLTLLTEEKGNMTTAVPNLLVGCSISSYRQPEGVTGISLPAQLGLQSFSYCLVSHRYDDNNQSVSSNLVLNWEEDHGDDRTPKMIQYTPFVGTQESLYYYVKLQQILVGQKQIQIPNHLQVANSTSGYGGTVVDLGTTFTMMVKEVFDPVMQELDKQVPSYYKYNRSTELETETGLGRCYNTSAINVITGDDLPKISLGFGGQVNMTLPFENSFVYKSNESVGSVLCTTMMLDVYGLGPAIILGNYMQQNFHLEFDLNKNQLGFYQKDCARG